MRRWHRALITGASSGIDAALARVADRLRDDAAPVDLLINNAGLGFVGPLHRADPRREATMLDVNLVAVHRLAQAAATAFVARGRRAGILNVSHIPAWMWQSADEVEVAAAGLAGVAANRPVVVAGWHNRVSVALMNALPGAVRRRAMARMSR